MAVADNALIDMASAIILESVVNFLAAIANVSCGY